MTASHALQSLLALAPVCIFLGGLLYIDSYKLVRFTRVLELIVAGAGAAALSYFINTAILGAALMNRETLSGIVAPAVEEAVKFIPILLLLRAGRIGFVIDAAICGFAAGAGFALVENVYYLSSVADGGAALWVVRGFGTAILHGGTTAIAAMLAKVLLQQSDTAALRMTVPALLVAIAFHALFNQFLLSPMMSAAVVIAILPPLLVFVFGLSERHLQAWLRAGLDIDEELLHAIHSGDFASSRAGRYLQELSKRFKGPVVGDMLCYLRLYCELSLRAKGILMLRGNGLPVPHDPDTASKVTELRYLKGSIGPTGQLALAPLVHRSSYDLWQLQLLEES